MGRKKVVPVVLERDPFIDDKATALQYDFPTTLHFAGLFVSPSQLFIRIVSGCRITASTHSSATGLTSRYI